MNTINGLAATGPMLDAPTSLPESVDHGGTRRVPGDAVAEGPIVTELDPIDQELADSFPASDPPSWGRLGI